MFWSWSPSSTQLRLSWHWGPSKPARQNRGHGGRRWNGCPPCYRFALEGGVGTGGYRKWTGSRWISDEQWSVACHLLTSPVYSRVAYPLPRPPRFWGSTIPASWSRFEVISMRRQWETVSNAFGMSTDMAIVLLGGLRWLMPENTLAEIWSIWRRWSASLWSHAGRGECPSPPRWTGGWAALISSLPGRAVRWGDRSGLALVASLPLRLQGCWFRRLSGLRAPSGRPDHAHIDGRGGTRWAHQAPERWMSPPSYWPLRRLSRLTACVGDPLGRGGGGSSRAVWWPDLVGQNRRWTACWRLVQSPSGWSGFFHRRRLRWYSTSCRPACAVGTSSAWDWLNTFAYIGRYLIRCLQ